MEMNKMTNDELLDAAACDAMGSHTFGESAAYQHELAAAGAPAQAIDRQMRETVGALAAASPHMEPSGDLRARILHATAPRSFRLEDYRKASRDDVRYFKWGFYAAAMFLVLGGLYNIYTRSQLTQAVSVIQQANGEIKDLQQKNVVIAQDALARNAALAAFVNPHGEQILFQDKGQLVGRGIIDRTNHTALLVFAQESVPAGFQAQLTIPDASGKPVAYQTGVLTAPSTTVGLAVAPIGLIPQTVHVQSLTPDDAHQPKIATW